MLTKKAVSLILCIAMLLTMAILPVTMASAADIAESSVNTGTDYNLASNIKDGNILHAFNWKMQDIKDHAAEIAAAGFTTVQISPIQKSKEAANIGSYATDWWAYYQPIDFTVGNALGTQADLKSMTTELHKYGIKVIADVVTNHTTDFNYDTKAEAKAAWAAMNSTVKTFYRRPDTYESYTKTSDNSRDTMTTYDLGGLKDLNTESSAYQQYLINNLINPLSDSGVDGFRFDAAKHIGTPDDSGNSYSNFWPTITSAIKAKNSNAYIYGEVLSLAGKLNISAYTKYMNVTDYNYGNTVRSALNSSNASSLVNYGYTGSQKGQNVLWVESHDNFCDGVSLSLSKAKQIVGWAAIGARKDAPALFFVRPEHESLDSPGFIKYDELMGFYGSADTWQNKSVVEVNKFKNAFAGQNETVTASGSMLFVQRGTSGMVISNLAATSASVNQSCSMTAGSYVDQVTGKTFNVSGGKITGQIGSSGVAVIYNKTAQNSAPEVSVTLDGTKIASGVPAAYANTTAKLAVTVSNATEATVQFGNLNARTATLNGTTTFTLNSSVANGKSIPVTVTAKNGSKSTSTTYNIVKDTNTGSRTVYFDNTATKWENVYVFCKNSESATGQFSNSIKMNKTSGNIYSATIPSGTTYVKFHGGVMSKHIGHSSSQCGGYCGPTLPPTVIIYGANSNLSDAQRSKGGYHIVGTMICKNLHVEPYNYNSGTLSDSDVTGGSTTPTQPTTQPPTQPSTQKPTTPTQPATQSTGKLKLGDADRDDKITVLDATKIQKMLASLVPKFDADTTRCANVDGDTAVSVIDATLIQKYLASVSVPYAIGTYLDGEPATTAPQPVTSAPEPYTDAPDPPTESYELQKLSNRWVAMVYCKAFSEDETKQTVQMDLDEYGRMTYDFPDASYIFCRNYDTGVQYCTDGWAGFVNPVTLVNEHALSSISNFDKMYVPAGEHTIYLQYDSVSDTCTLSYDMISPVGPVIVPTTGPDDPTPGGDDLTFVPGESSVADPAWFGWVWNNGSEGQWVAGNSDSSGNVIFPGAMAYENITIVRMPTGSTQGDWNTFWNQSDDIAIQQGKTLYFKSWNNVKFNVEWR
ncbi:MAG: hypothetical protein IJH32_09450 [Ruminococcus sp.]|nr:hypothetical protein [Ruminococcus sp.]